MIENTNIPTENKHTEIDRFQQKIKFNYSCCPGRVAKAGSVGVLMPKEVISPTSQVLLTAESFLRPLGCFFFLNYTH